MENKKSILVLIATILNGLELAFFGFFTLMMFAFKGSSEFEAGFSEGFSEGSGLDVSGSDVSELLYIVGFIFLVFTIYSLIKFIFGLLGYIRNNRNFVLVSAIVNAIGAVFFTIMFSPFAVFEIIICVLMFIGFSKMRVINNNNNIGNSPGNTINNGVEL